MQVVNRVLTCSFSLPLSLSECQQRANVFKLSSSLYNHRPQMLRIRYQGPEGTYSLILFSSGKARYMGKDEDALNHLLQIESDLIPAYRLTPLTETTRTVRMHLDIPSTYLPLNVCEFPKGCMWEPELFPAIQFQQWSPVCVNLFHSGIAMILGSTTDSQLFVIRDALTDFIKYNCTPH
jgi:TATA-box binding protein (TBP) (component of TFIID and TFIIIB)